MGAINQNISVVSKVAAARQELSIISKIASVLMGALFGALEASQGLGWRAVLLAIVCCIWEAILFIVTKRSWQRYATQRGRALVAVFSFFGILLPLPWAYGRWIDYILLPDSLPAFRLSSVPYPNMLVVLPSQERTASFHAFLKCRASGPACTNHTSPLNYSVILFSEVGEMIGALTRSNLKPQITFAAAWLDNTEPTPTAAFHDQDVVILGGPVSTAYFSLARDAIIAKLKPNGFNSLPIDFSEYIYAQAETTEVYVDDSRNAIVTRYDGDVPNHPAIPEKDSLAFACSNGRLDYYAVAIPRELRSTPRFPCTSADTAVPVEPASVAPHTHEDDREYKVDWAFFVKGPNPATPRNQILLAAGLHAEGSRCALSYLLEIKDSGLMEMRKHGDDLHTEHHYVSGLLRCESDKTGMKPRLIRTAVF